MNALRIGHGYDVHRFGEGDYIVLGGVKIAHTEGLMAHSDGDVLLHAVCDALLGAAGLGDIGKHFPDTSERWRGADSRELLRSVVAMLCDRSLMVQNVDSTIIAQAPRVSKFTEQMQKNIAADLHIDVEKVNVKATTTEKLGFIGEKKGIAAESVVLLCER